jgi:hypothetical protein
MKSNKNFCVRYKGRCARGCLRSDEVGGRAGVNRGKAWLLASAMGDEVWLCGVWPFMTARERASLFN